MAILKALLVGQPQTYGDITATEPLKKAWRTAIFKQACMDEIYADEFGLAGDAVADTIHHGGREKAIFANSLQNYAAWEEFLGLKNLAYGALGENFTIDGLSENSVCIGDVHQIGSLTLQVSQPRKPCYKLSMRWSNSDMTAFIARSGLTGWYYRVLEKGSCRAGDEIKVVRRDEMAMSVMELNRLFHGGERDGALLEKFKRLDALTPKWREDMEKKLNGSYNADYMKTL